MWSTEHSVETDAAREEIWRLWADVAAWPEWNAGIECVELHGPFAVGSRIDMRPTGGEPVELRLAEVVEPALFVDVADVGELVVRTTHHAEPIAGGRTRVTYRMEITGPTADTLGTCIGPEISSDFPHVLAALVALAER